MSSSCSLEASPKASHLHVGESVECFRAYLQCYGSSDFNYVFSFAAVLFLGNLRTRTFRLHLMLWRIIFFTTQEGSSFSPIYLFIYNVQVRALSLGMILSDDQH